jgi:hypothetical protein
VLIGAVASTEVVATAPTSLSTPVATISNHHANAVHDPHTITGIVFGVFVGIAFLAALVAWFFRLRMHRRRRRARGGISWSPDSSDDTERGLPYLYDGEKSDSPIEASIWGSEKDVGEPKRTFSWTHAKTLRGTLSPIRREAGSPFADLPPQRRVVSEMRVPPTPSSLYDMPFHAIRDNAISCNPSASQPGSGGPEIFVQTAPFANNCGLHEPPNSVTSETLEGPTTFGTLRIANAMPGDRYSSSGSEMTSAPSTSTSPLALGSEFGTPREPLGIAAPRFLGVTGGGLNMPEYQLNGNCLLAPPTPLFALACPSSPRPERDEMPLMDTAVLNASTSANSLAPGTAGWAASIRANLTSALAAVAERTGLGTAPSSAVGDGLTPAPVRGRRARVRDVEWGNRSEEESDGTVLSRTSTVLNQSSLRAPEKAVLKGSPQRQSLEMGMATLSRASSVYSSASVNDSEAEIGPKRPIAKQSPSFSPLSVLSREGSLSSGDERTREGAANALARIRERAANRPRPSAASAHSYRPKLVVRTSWSASSEEGESEVESPNREEWTDDEKRAQKMLLERRKLNMGAGGKVARARLVGLKSVRRTGTKRSGKSMKM